MSNLLPFEVSEEEFQDAPTAKWALPAQALIRHTGYVGLLGHVAWVGEELHYGFRRLLTEWRRTSPPPQLGAPPP
jgi:hypothetical protein